MHIKSARNKISSSHHALNSLLFAPDGYPTATEDPAEIEETVRTGAVGGGEARSGRERRDWVPRNLGRLYFLAELTRNIQNSIKVVMPLELHFFRSPCQLSVPIQEWCGSFWPASCICCLQLPYTLPSLLSIFPCPLCIICQLANPLFLGFVHSGLHNSLLFPECPLIGNAVGLQEFVMSCLLASISGCS